MWNINSNIILYLGLTMASMVIRAGISLHPYSGYDTPPMYGDFEAQRHWQEITVNLPIKDWYKNTTDNDLMYWGLDYPPLTAYHSWILGKFANKINPKFIELHQSRGITNEEHKNFMRISSLLCDLLIYIPSLIISCYAIHKKLIINKKHNKLKDFVDHLVIALLYPGQILIDNGHFQYNNVSLGLAAFAFSSIFHDRNIMGSIFFVLALNYKQMELYHALPMFFYLLGNCFIKRNNETNSFASKLKRLRKLALVVIITFVIIWMPWLTSIDQFLQVLHRIFPIARGVFEDKVSNVWCVVNVFIKIKENFSNVLMAKICIVTTLVSVLPSCLNLLWNPRKEGFLLALINCSLAFFLFSFQEVVDESDGCGGKFNTIIVSPQFEGKSLIQRHRLVNTALSDELKTIHAFSQKTFTPQQWTEQNK